MMDSPEELHAQQVAYWNGSGGDHWVINQDLTDQVLAPVATLVLGAAAVRPGEHVIDVGCGCGVTVLALAEAVGPEGHVLGVDVSAPMLARAAARVGDQAGVRLVEADAATYPFTRGAADLLFSRFGVMFFGDPTAAFANLRLALKPGARVVFACWRTPAENPWMMVPVHAAYEHVPPLPKPGPEDPGPFSFAEPARVERILGGAGFEQVTMEPVDLTLDVSAGGGLTRAVAYSLAIGATSRALEGASPAVRDAVAASISQAFAPYVKGDRVLLAGGIWLVRAIAR